MIDFLLGLLHQFASIKMLQEEQGTIRETMFFVLKILEGPLLPRLEAE